MTYISRYDGSGEHGPQDDMAAFFMNDPVIQQRAQQLLAQSAPQQAPSSGPVPLRGASSPQAEGSVAQAPQAAQVAPSPNGNPLNNLIDSVIGRTDGGGVDTASADAALAGINSQRAELAQQQDAANQVGGYTPDESDLPTEKVDAPAGIPTDESGGINWLALLGGLAGGGAALYGASKLFGGQSAGATVQPDGSVAPNAQPSVQGGLPARVNPVDAGGADPRQLMAPDGIVDAQFTELDNGRLPDLSSASNDTPALPAPPKNSIGVDTEIADTDVQKGAQIDADLRRLDDTTLRNAQAALAQGDFEAADGILADSGSGVRISNEADADRIGAAIDAALEALPARGRAPKVNIEVPRVRLR